MKKFDFVDFVDETFAKCVSKQRERDDYLLLSSLSQSDDE